MTSSDQISDVLPVTQQPVAPQRNRWRTAALALAVVVALCLGVIGFLSIQLSRATSASQEEEAVEAAVRRFAVELTTYDHTTVTKDIDQVLALSTGSFQKEYKDVLGGDTFAEALVKAKGMSKGEVMSVYVTDLTDDRAEAIVVLDQTVTNAEDTAPKTERRRLEVTMVKTTSGWKTDRVSVI